MNQFNILPRNSRLLLKLPVRCFKAFLARLNLASDTRVVVDVQGRYYLLFTGQWSIKWALDNNPGLTLVDFDHM